MDKKVKASDKLWNLFFGLANLNRFKDAEKILDLLSGFVKSNRNISALRAWSVKARRVIGEIKA